MAKPRHYSQQNTDAAPDCPSYQPPRVVDTAEFETLALQCTQNPDTGGGPMCDAIPGSS